MPNTSVIVPVFNDQQGIERCILALRAQTAPRESFEIIVVDNGSKPAIYLATAEYNVILIRCNTPGSYAARNAGVAASTGRTLAFTDADCEPSPDWIENGRAALAEAPGTIVGGEVLVSHPDPRTGTGLYQHIIGFRQRENIEDRGFAVTANMFCTRQDFLTIGEFQTSLLSGGDMEWGHRALKAGIPTVYAAGVIVTTPPRVTLLSAIRQARRVAGGRRQLATMGFEWVGKKRFRHRHSRLRTLLSSAQSKKLSLPETARVVVAAFSIYAATAFETVRLMFGGLAERR